MAILVYPPVRPYRDNVGVIVPPSETLQRSLGAKSVQPQPLTLDHFVIVYQIVQFSAAN